MGETLKPADGKGRGQALHAKNNSMTERHSLTSSTRPGSVDTAPSTRGALKRSGPADPALSHPEKTGISAVKPRTELTTQPAVVKASHDAGSGRLVEGSGGTDQNVAKVPAGGSGEGGKPPGGGLPAVPEPLGEDPENRANNSEARRALTTQIREGARFFGNPDLLREASEVITDALSSDTLLLSGQFPGFRESPYENRDYRYLADYTQDGNSADTYISYPPEPGKPTVHVGFKDGRVHEIVCEQRNAEGAKVYETQVIFFGLGDKDAAERGEQELVKMYYPLLLSDENGLARKRAPEEDYPPIGVFVNFSVLDDNNNELARLYGKVGAETTKDNISNTRLDGEPGNREVFPWLAENILPDQDFGIIVDNTTLLPFAQTLRPDFLSEDVIAGWRRIETTLQETTATESSPQTEQDIRKKVRIVFGGHNESDIPNLNSFHQEIDEMLTTHPEGHVAVFVEDFDVLPWRAQKIQHLVSEAWLPSEAYIGTLSSYYDQPVTLDDVQYWKRMHGHGLLNPLDPKEYDLYEDRLTRFPGTIISIGEARPYTREQVQQWRDANRIKIEDPYTRKQYHELDEIVQDNPGRILLFPERREWLDEYLAEAHAKRKHSLQTIISNAANGNFLGEKFQEWLFYLSRETGLRDKALSNHVNKILRADIVVGAVVSRGPGHVASADEIETFDNFSVQSIFPEAEFDDFIPNPIQATIAQHRDFREKNWRNYLTADEAKLALAQTFIWRTVTPIARKRGVNEQQVLQSLSGIFADLTIDDVHAFEAELHESGIKGSVVMRNAVEKIFADARERQDSRKVQEATVFEHAATSHNPSTIELKDLIDAGLKTALENATVNPQRLGRGSQFLVNELVQYPGIVVKRLRAEEELPDMGELTLEEYWQKLQKDHALAAKYFGDRFIPPTEFIVVDTNFGDPTPESFTVPQGQEHVMVQEKIIGQQIHSYDFLDPELEFPESHPRLKGEVIEFIKRYENMTRHAGQVPEEFMIDFQKGEIKLSDTNHFISFRDTVSTYAKSFCDTFNIDPGTLQTSQDLIHAIVTKLPEAFGHIDEHDYPEVLRAFEMFSPESKLAYQQLNQLPSHGHESRNRNFATLTTMVELFPPVGEHSKLVRGLMNKFAITAEEIEPNSQQDN